MSLKTYISGLLKSRRAKRFAESIPSPKIANPEPETHPGQLESYFDSNTEGPGIWKWRHYFPVYEQYLARFIDKSPTLVEVGIYSGGSMGMWRDFLGESSNIVGIDIEPACKTYESPGVEVVIGDQGSREFWSDFRKHHPKVDIFIDDGSHDQKHQIITLEEMLPHLSPGGVFVCEDVHGIPHHFSTYVSTLATKLHSLKISPFQEHIYSIHQYPFLVVIEKNARKIDQFHSGKRGTEWQPFFDENDRPVKS